MIKPVYFSDNICVKSGKSGNDFFQATVCDPDPEKEWQLYTVSISRYCVPGRCDYYDFDFVPGSSGVGNRIRFFTDGNGTVAEALANAQRDLNKSQVVNLLTDMVGRPGLLRHMRSLAEDLLASIAPKSKALSDLRKAIKVRLAERKLECSAS